MSEASGRRHAGGRTDRQSSFVLRRAGCDVGQGYLFAKPMSAAELTQLLREKRRMVMAA